MGQHLHWIDWIVIIFFLASILAVGSYFMRRASKGIDAFFVSGRSLPWYIAGASLVTTSFAADTPLWITSLIRQHGVYYVWQYWAPFIGGALAMMLFARLWRRMGVLTDIEFIEQRYSGSAAGVLRFFSGASLALFFCPLIIGWVTKAMEIITRSAMGLSPEHRIWTTIAVVAVALVTSTMAGLWGAVYADFLQFFVAIFGTILLAAAAVNRVGGLNAMVEQIIALKGSQATTLNIAPQFGSGPGQMSLWNAIGYFGILWIMVAQSGGYNAQRLLACKNVRHSSFAMMMHTIVYYGVICWPWIIVGVCSIIILPTLGEGVTDDNAYPRMIMVLMPVGLRGLVIAAMLAAFVSTMCTLFNWGSSYLVNDIYRRFIKRNASATHYVWIARAATVLMASAGGVISFIAHDIQQLLAISFVIGSGTVIVACMRWFWWRLNATGDLVATMAAWVIAPLLLFGKVFDGPARVLLGLDASVEFSTDPNLIGARMLFMVITVTAVAVIVSYCTPPTDMERLKEFVIRAKPMRFFWKPVIRQLSVEYHENESFERTMVSWFIAVICIGSLIFGIGKLLFGSRWLGIVLLCLFLGLLYVTICRINSDFVGDCDSTEGDAKIESGVTKHSK